jgi:opacity protein-like surface antigen
MKLKSVLLASVVLVGLPSLASAEPMDSWYVSVGGGINSLDDVDGVLTSTGGATAPFELGFDTGWALNGAVGHGWDVLRLEFELAYRQNDVEFFNTPAVTTSGDVTTFAQMLNLVFEVPLGDSVELSLGGGLGGALVDVDIIGTSGGDVATLSDDDYVFAYQAIAGLSVDVGERTEIFAEYRYFVTEEAEISGAAPPDFFFTSDFDTENQTGLIGIRYFFGEEAAVVEEPPPPPPPMTNFTIYFNKKGALSAEAHATLQEAADVHKGGAPTVTIAAQGGGPRAGDAVTRALVDLGVAEEKISVQTHDSGDATITITQ